MKKKRNFSNPESLNLYFKSVEELEKYYREDPFYNESIRNLFAKCIPYNDMTKDELKNHFRDLISKSNIVHIKIIRWLDGFIENELERKTPNEMIYSQLTLPNINLNLSVEMLKKIYQIKQSTRTIYTWVNKDKLIPSSNTGTRLYSRLDFEDMLNRKGIEFNKEHVVKLLNVDELTKKLNQ